MLTIKICTSEFWQRCNSVEGKGRIAFTTNGAQTTRYLSIGKKKKKTQNNLNLNLTYYAKINSKCILDLNVK